MAFTAFELSSNSIAITDEEAFGILDKYNYIDLNHLRKANPDLSIEDVSDEIGLFQEMAGLEITGVLDIKTRAKMGEPRCQVPDFLTVPKSNSNRRKRQTYEYQNKNKWGITDLKYKIMNFGSSSILTEPDVNKFVKKSLDVWSEVAPLTFSPTDEEIAYQVGLSFQRGNHGDQLPFVDIKTIGHTFFPPYQDALTLSYSQHKMGNMHMNDDITWNINEGDDVFTIGGPDKGKKCVFPFIYGGKSYYNCFQLSISSGDKEAYRFLCATTTILTPFSKSWGYCGHSFYQATVHEIGHVLGLNHINNPDAVMYQYAKPYISDYQLHQDDIDAVQNLYNLFPSTTSTTSTTSSTTTGSTIPTTNFDHIAPDAPKLDVCNDGSLDAITSNGKKDTLVFKGAYFFKVIWTGVALGYPKLIRDIWGSVPDNIDAAYYTRKKICRYKWVDSSWEYNCPETDLHFFFKGEYVWRFENELEISKTLISETFKGLPNDIDSIFYYASTGYTYVTKGKQFYRLTYNLAGVATGYPRDISYWVLNSLIFNLEKISAAYNDPNGNYFYFFVDKNFYFFNQRSSMIPETYPKNTGVFWFRCKAYDSIVLENLASNSKGGIR